MDNINGDSINETKNETVEKVSENEIKIIETKVLETIKSKEEISFDIEQKNKILANIQSEIDRLTTAKTEIETEKAKLETYLTL